MPILRNSKNEMTTAAQEATMPQRKAVKVCLRLFIQPKKSEENSISGMARGMQRFCSRFWLWLMLSVWGEASETSPLKDIMMPKAYANTMVPILEKILNRSYSQIISSGHKR